MTRLPQKTRDAVLARDNFQCAGCGVTVGGAFTWWSIQHRVARGVGGTNDPQNCICLCGSATSKGCHRTCEDRDATMHDRGLWLRSDEDPALFPVTYWDGRVVYLTPDGGHSAEPPGEAAA
jgi:5-methylcytosine-specific restriction endonuclease McrA